MAPNSPSAFHDYARQFVRGRRPRNANPYDASHHATPETVSTRDSNPSRSQVPPQNMRGLEEPDHEELEDEEEDEEEGEEDDQQVSDADADQEEDGDGVDVGDTTEDIELDVVHGEEAHEAPMDLDSIFDPTGLKEIGNLASWTVSTCKPGCGVEALRDEDTNLFWQSDGPQPHHLNIHFSRLVSILSIRIFLDFEADESYTPTRITLLAGTGYHDLIPFSSLEFTQPKGWIDVPLEGVGGGDGNTLRAFLVQVKIVENHQNGKDTHVRGLKIYAKDERVGGNLGGLDEWDTEGKTKVFKPKANIERMGMMAEPEWMGEPGLR